MRDAKISISMLLFMVMLPAAYSQASLTVFYTDNNLTADPLNSVWNSATPTAVNLGPQQMVAPNGGKEVQIKVRGLHNGRFIGFLMEWDDATKDTNITGDGYRDGAALQFPLEQEAWACMGNPGIVNIWFWRGDWQADLEGGGYLDTQYPTYGGFNFPQDEQLFLKEVRGGNIITASPVEDLNAEGFGTLKIQEHQNVAGKGVYSTGRWLVAFVRPMQTNDEFDAQFKQGTTSKISFAVWNGSNGDRGGRKSMKLAWTNLAISEIAAPVEAMQAETKTGRELPYRTLSVALVILVVLGAAGWVILKIMRRTR